MLPGAKDFPGHQAAAGRSLDALQAVIVTSMKKGGVASFYGPGRFYVGHAVHQFGRQRGKILPRQESAWI